eukprot:PLAT805.1.p1 GENE.PLAT805.1~~PLAT805.1.p1  ORF type:complete len:302 (-),score=96.87 PLAT805.1:57-962(-)
MAALVALARRLAAILRRLRLLLARSSGRDKLCAMLQYGSMWRRYNMPLRARRLATGVSLARVERSMKGARKVFRMLRFVNEAEAMLRLVEAGSSRLGTRVAMHGAAFAYYALDNAVWALQVQLLGNGQGTELAIATLKSRKNWASLARTLLALLLEQANCRESALLLLHLHRRSPLLSVDEQPSGAAELAAAREALISSSMRLCQLLCNGSMLLTRLRFLRLQPRTLAALGFVSAVLSLTRHWREDSRITARTAAARRAKEEQAERSSGVDGAGDDEMPSLSFLSPKRSAKISLTKASKQL